MAAAAYPQAFVSRVLDAVASPMAHARARPFVLGLSGAQGSGKSTLAAQLCATARANGIQCEVLALDDFYLPAPARATLARCVHALLRTRGVPGTHDVALLESVLAHAAAGEQFALPCFDKGRDTRTGWRRVRSPPALLVLEGWCVGVPAQAPAALQRARNALERVHDRDRTWREYVNAQLAGPYAVLWRHIDLLVLLQAPGFADAVRWRRQAERSLRRRADAPRALDAPSLAEFMQHFERIARHALRVLPRIADVLVRLDRDRRVAAVRERG